MLWEADRSLKERTCAEDQLKDTLTDCKELDRAELHGAEL